MNKRKRMRNFLHNKTCRELFSQLIKYYILYSYNCNMVNISILLFYVFVFFFSASFFHFLFGRI